MKNIYLKLASSVLSILMALTMMVGATFAWFTFSTSPEVGGMSVSIGGGRTIMLAPDIRETVETEGGESVTVHYPGEFGSVLTFAEHEESYGYLKEVSGLSPVSTADGKYWMLPAYEEETGALKRFSEFCVDDKLEYANGTEEQKGSYVYLDFWIVSPGSEFEVRVSTDVKSNLGSYLVELPISEDSSNGTLDLTSIPGMVGATARIGFLVNTEEVSDETMTCYEASQAHVRQYRNLVGNYQEKGQKISGEYQFSIYEPNGTIHPSEGLEEGTYLITRPLLYNPYMDAISEEDVSDRLMVQEPNTWTTSSLLSTDYEQGRISAYVKSGDFYTNTERLYGATEAGVVTEAALEQLTLAGAVDDVMITRLSPNVPQRIRMFIWLEGQDADCRNVESVEASALALNLELAGAGT